MRAADPVSSAARAIEDARPRRAFRILLAAARAGRPEVFLNLGFAYDVGQGVRRCKRKALHWYHRAFANGEASAAYNMATVYRDRGDVLRAVRWSRHAVELGESGSNVLLGQLLLGRLGDPEGALEAFHRVGADACQADVENAAVWAATVEGMLAGPEGRLRGQSTGEDE